MCVCVYVCACVRVCVCVCLQLCLCVSECSGTVRFSIFYIQHHTKHNLNDIIYFRHHLALPSEADTHFRAVCRALVSEALELSSFMEKVSSSRGDVEVDSELGQLDIQDWVGIRISQIQGVQQKKSCFQNVFPFMSL